MNDAFAEFPINPLLLYVACAVGAFGVALALPRRGSGPAVVGGLIAGVAAGLVALGLFWAAEESGGLPNVFFYVFSLMALGGGLRMITHPKPVYAALYFVLTIISSSGLYLLLSAEFMAFALIIIYAGAILITYLFVIMLATQAPSSEDTSSLTGYDASAREPIAASATGFVLLALVSTMMLRGAPSLEARPGLASSDAVLSHLPGKVEDRLFDSLRDRGLVEEGEHLASIGVGGVWPVDSARREVVVAPGDRVVVVPDDLWPADLVGTNVEGLGLNLLGEHPMTIEMAGVVLLMAMLGATVLARKQVDIEDEAKARQARRLAVEGRR